MGEKRHTIRNGIIVTVMGGLILAGILSDWFRLHLWQLITSIAKPLVLFGHWIKNDTVLPNWLFLTLGILSIITIIRALSAIRRMNGNATERYDHDEVFGIIWRWSGDPYQTYNLCPFCPHCDGELLYHDQRRDSFRIDNFLNKPDFTQFKCENCGFCSVEIDGDHQNAFGRTQREIGRRYRTGEWQNDNNAKDKSKSLS
jgi:hypothetical protein